jgi:hypothetical protein
MRTLLIIILSFQLCNIFGQTTKTIEKSIRGSVVDRTTDAGIPFAVIRSSENQFAKADENGNFTLLVNSDSNLTITGYVFGYYKDSVKLNMNTYTKLFLKPIPVDSDDWLVMTGNPTDTTYYKSGKVESINYQYKNSITFYENGKVKSKTVNGSLRTWYPTGILQYQSLLKTPHYRIITEWYESGNIKITGSKSWRTNPQANSGDWYKNRDWKHYKKS